MRIAAVTLAALAAAAATPAGAAAGSVAGAGFRTGYELATVGSPYTWLSPIAIVQKADLVADLPDDARFEAYDGEGKAVPLDLGQGIRELRLLWMPFLAWKEDDWVFFSRSDSGTYSLAPATFVELWRLQRVLGRDPREGYSFNPLPRMWGWLALIPLGFAWRAWRRRDDRLRAENGTM